MAREGLVDPFERGSERRVAREQLAPHRVPLPALAAQLTRSVDGVVDVVNRLTYRADDAPFAPTRQATSRQ